MSWTTARNYVAKTAGANAIVVTCAVRVRESDHAIRVTISLNQRAQEALFGGSLIGEKMRVDVGRAVDLGKLRLCKATDGAEVKAGPRGMARIALAGWDLLDRESHPASPMRFVASVPEGVVFDLPAWGQAEASRARMDREFGLPRSVKPSEGGGGVTWPC